jgi:two-component system phosphate regulon sensor histidine kinase PhoR
MSSVLASVLRTLLAMTGGAALGWLLGNWLGAGGVGAFIGAALAVSTVVALDSLHGHRLLGWLRSPERGSLPDGPGLWGELGYRIDRLLQQHVKAQQAEARRLAQFLSAIEASPSGVLLLDAEGRIDWCNTVSADHFGLNPRRDHAQRLTHLVRAPAFVTYLQAHQFDHPAHVTSPDGRTTLAVQAREFGDGMMLVLSQDITERERTEGMRRDFVANVSHEIRSPLTVLAGFVETLATLPLTEVEQRRVLTLMQQQTDRMQVLVADLLTLAKLEGGPRPPSDRWVSLPRLATQLETDAVGLSAGRHRIERVPSAALEIAGSEPELHSAIGNLLSNAVRYTPEGGRITLGWTLRDDGAVVVTVADTGVGVTREHIPRLTERFYRVDGSRSRETGGTGLGLSIVKHVMQRHGGEIEIESEPGAGSRFMLVFPAVRSRAPAGNAPLMTPSAATLP